jgi:Protein of unknown function (DUF3106)
VAKAARALIFSLLAGLGAMVAMVSVGAMDAHAQQPTTRKSEAAKPARPLWSELSPQQQHILGPLAADWENMDTTRRKKWVTIANRYPKMKPDQQQRLQERMQAWAKLTPEERSIARAKYQKLNELPQPQRQEISRKWRQQSQSVTPRNTAPEATPDTVAPDAPGK